MSDPVMADHAELARLCGEANSATTVWHADKALRAIEQICSPDYLLALLAENAALRARLGGALEGECRCCVLTRAKCADTVAEAEIGRTEAERKLAEADQVIRDIAETPYTGADWPRSRAVTFLASMEPKT